MSAIGADALSHVVIEVADPARALAFYTDVLGAGDAVPWAEPGARAIRLTSGAFIVLVESAKPTTFADTGAHVAYRAAPKAIAAVAARAQTAGITVHRYVEDRPEEVPNNYYLADADGNRVQLVAGEGPDGGIGGIDHAVAMVSDIEWEDDFWVETLGLKAVHRVGWATQDFVRARAWGEGAEDMAPGTRRWDQRYRDIPGGKPGQGRKVARPNPQLFLDFGGPVIGLFLTQAHMQEPPLETIRGTPRIALSVADEALAGIARALADAGGRVEGPLAHGAGGALARSVYLRDRCGVFFEFCSRN